MSRNRSGNFTVERLEHRQLFAAVSGNIPRTIPKIIHETVASAFTADLGKAEPYIFSSSTVTSAAKSKATSTAETFVFHSIIHWGDGKTSVGTAVENTDGTFDIDGTHTYKTTGRYHILVTISRSPSGPGPQPEFIELYTPLHVTAEVSSG